MVVVNCEQVWREISNYIDDEIDAPLRSAVDEHLHQCPRCTAVLEGTRNVVQLYGDERLFSVPMGYSWRLQRRLASNMPSRRGFLGWVFATAALALVAGSVAFENWREGGAPLPRSAHGNPGHDVPPNLAVLVDVHGKLFHIKGCPFMDQKDQIEAMTAAAAEEKGYQPCVRCLGQYVREVAANFGSTNPRPV